MLVLYPPQDFACLPFCGKMKDFVGLIPSAIAFIPDFENQSGNTEVDTHIHSVMLVQDFVFLEEGKYGEWRLSFE
jgi:hypothetical protein